MRDAGNDYRDDVGDDLRWLSYGELGQARGISTASAIRLVPSGFAPFCVAGRDWSSV
jgi:hypothetical protein